MIDRGNYGIAVVTGVSLAKNGKSLLPGAQASLPATDVASTFVPDLRRLDFEFVTPLRQRRCRQGCLRSRHWMPYSHIWKVRPKVES